MPNLIPNHPSPTDFVEGIIRGLLPPGEPFVVRETYSTERIPLLVIDAQNQKARSILMGRDGATIAALRRLVNVAAWNWQKRVNVELEGDMNRERNQAAAAVR